MRSVLIILASLMSLVTAAQTPLEQGIEWFGRRAEGAVGTRARPEPMDKAIPYFQKAMATPTDELRSGIFLIRSFIYKGRFVETERVEQKRTLEKGVKVAEALVKKYPTSPELRFQYICALGLWGDKMGMLEAAKAGIVDRVMTETATLIKLDPEYHNSMGKRTEGIMNYRVPKIPFLLSWPDKKKALSMLKEVLHKYPNDMGNIYYYGEALYENDQPEQAKVYLNRVMTISPDPEFILEHRAMHDDARRLLNRINGR